MHDQKLQSHITQKVVQKLHMAHATDFFCYITLNSSHDIEETHPKLIIREVFELLAHPLYEK